MTREGWLKLLRFLSTAIGIGIWLASIYFSAIFFGVKNEELVWVGILIAIAVTMLELVWRKPGMKGNTTINILAVTAYVYGITTNTLGIMLAWGFNGDKVSGNYFFSNVDSLILALFPGIILEVLAEPLVTWGLIGDAMADLLGNTVDMLNNGGKDSQHNNNQNQNNGNRNNSNGGKNQSRQNNNQRNNNENNRHNQRHDYYNDDEDDYEELRVDNRLLGREVRQQQSRNQQRQNENGNSRKEKNHSNNHRLF